MTMRSNEIQLYFGKELANLYELGWISADLSRLIDFSELIDTNDITRAEKYFGDKAKPFNRYVSLSDKSRRPEIVGVKEGSIELAIAVVGVSATIIMPLVAILVKRHFDNVDEVVELQIHPRDPTLRRLIHRYENGDLGTGKIGFDTLMNLLEQENYNVTGLTNNFYIVEHVIEKYSQRIVKTIKKNL